MRWGFGLDRKGGDTTSSGAARGRFATMVTTTGDTRVSMVTDCPPLIPVITLISYCTCSLLCITVVFASKGGVAVSTDKVLQADLTAMGKVGPHLRTSAEEIRRRIPTSDPVSAGADPGLAALEAFSKAISDVERIAAARLETISDIYDEAHKAFVTAEQLYAAHQRLPSIYQRPTQV